MLDVQQRIEAPITSLALSATGGANVSPDLMQRIRRVFNFDNATVRSLSLITIIN